MYLYHYYDKSGTPFRNLSELPVPEAKAVLEKIKAEKPSSKSAERHDKYVEYRRNCEEILRTEFLKKGGKILRTPPHYMVVEHSPWLSTWFENCGFERGYKIIVPQLANTTFDNKFMTAEKSCEYYNNFIWNGRYAECISAEDTILKMKGLRK